MAEPSDHVNPERIFRKSMEDALMHIDKLKETLAIEQQKAVDLQIAAREELKRIERETDDISKVYFERNKEVYLEQIRNDVLFDVVRKLILSGVPSDRLRNLLDLTPKLLSAVWHDLGFEKMDEAHVGHVAYEGSVKSGIVVFYRNDCCLKFPYEMGQGNVLAAIEVPTEAEWENATGLSNADRGVVLDFLARRVVRDQAPNGYYYIHANRIEIQS